MINRIALGITILSTLSMLVSAVYGIFVLNALEGDPPHWWIQWMVTSAVWTLLAWMVWETRRSDY